MDKTAEQIAAGLTQACIFALVYAKITPTGELRINCNHLYPPTISALERRGLLIPHSSTLSEKGLAVRAILQAQENTNAD